MNKINLYSHYVIRNGKLMSVKKDEIHDNELYCYITTTPSTPPYIELMLLQRGEILESVVNTNYLNEESIKNFINKIGVFKNWWEEKVKI